MSFFTKTSKRNSAGEGGMALITMTMVIIIVGLVIASGMAILKVQREQLYIDDTQNLIAEIHKSLDAYVTKNGSLPCVASLTLSRTDPNYGRSTDCNTGAAAGTYSVTNSARGGRAVRIGAIPARTLSLPDKYMHDMYKRLFTYAVTEVAVTAPLDITLGAIDVTIFDENDAPDNNALNTPAGSVLYVLINHGSDGKGAYYAGGSTAPISSCTSSPGFDQENCNNDYTFTLRPVTTRSGARYFDDFVHYTNFFPPNCGASGELFDGTECVPPKDSFGGSYSIWLGGGAEPPSCRTPNMVTGDCTCPAKFDKMLLFEWYVPSCFMGFYSDGWRTSNCTLVYNICVKR